MVREDEFVLNFVITTLARESVATGGKWHHITNLHGPLELNLVGR